MNRVAAALRAFTAFWWDFIVGDDWRIAVGIITALAATAALATTAVPAWWIVPVAVVVMLGLSLREAIRTDLPGRSDRRPNTDDAAGR